MNKLFFLTILLLSACSFTPTPQEMEQAAQAHAGDYSLSPQKDAGPALARAKEHNARAAARLAPPPAAGGADEKFTPVAITAAHSLEGVWRVTEPHGIEVTGEGKGSYGSVEDEICRFARSGASFASACIGSDDFIGDREVSLKGTDLSWTAGTPPFYSATFTGHMDGATGFSGALRLRLFGVVSFNQLPVLGQKLPLDPEAEPALRHQLEAALSRSHGDFAKLGAVQLVAFADFLALYDQDRPRRRLAVFDVEFEHGWRICAIGLDSDTPPLSCR